MNLAVLGAVCGHATRTGLGAPDILPEIIDSVTRSATLLRAEKLFSRPPVINTSAANRFVSDLTAATAFGFLSLEGMTLDGKAVDLRRPDGPFLSRIISVVGLRLGDEGKGRTTEEIVSILREYSGLTEPVGLMFKVNGGANSGHTVYDTAGNKYAFNLVPAGIIDRSIRRIALGSDVVADPLKIIAEGVPLEAAGFEFWKRFVIDDRTMLCDITHRIRDLAREAVRVPPVGSTGAGVGPAYEDRGIRAHIPYSIFLGAKESFAVLMRERIRRCIAQVVEECRLTTEQWDKIFDNPVDPSSGESPGLLQRELRANEVSISAGLFSASDFDVLRFKGNAPFELNVEAIIDAYWTAGQRVRGCIGSVAVLAEQVLNTPRVAIIAEHGQAIGLDILHGQTPHTTSSNTTSSDVWHSGKLRATDPLHIVAVCKAYETAVGTHQLLTEMEPGHPLRLLLSPIEKGVTTGRQRKVSWPCAVQMGEALRWHGAQDLVINKVDLLTLQGDWRGPLKICVGYRDESGCVSTRMPSPDNPETRRALIPLYLELPGWTEDISKCRRFAELPLAAQRYIATLYAATLATANEGIAVSRKQQPYLTMVGVGKFQGEVVREIPQPEGLIDRAYRYNIESSGRVVILPDPPTAEPGFTPSVTWLTGVDPLTTSPVTVGGAAYVTPNW